MTDAEIVSAYHAGVVNDETYCWKDGMDDWLPLREIEQLSAACSATRAMAHPRRRSVDAGVARARRPRAAASRGHERPRRSDARSAATDALRPRRRGAQGRRARAARPTSSAASPRRAARKT